MKNNTVREYEKSKSLEELEADLVALRIRMAFQREFEDEISGIEKDIDGIIGEHKDFVDGLDLKIMKLIDSEYRKGQVKRFFSVQLPKAGKIIAALLLVFYLGLTTAVATVESVRMAVLELFMSFEDDYASFELRETGEYIDIPAGWEGDYYPTYIPDGYAITSISYASILFEDDQSNSIRFHEYSSNSFSNIDILRTYTTYEIIDGSIALVSEELGWITVVMTKDNCIFVVDCNLNRAEALKIANSITRIRT